MGVIWAETGLVAIRVDADSALRAMRGAVNALRNIVMGQKPYRSYADSRSRAEGRKGSGR